MTNNLKQTDFGYLISPFKKGEQLFNLIKEKHSINYITRIGILCKADFCLDIEGHYYPPIIISLNGQDFTLGQNGILELEDVKITSIKFKTDVTLPIEITYVYK